MVAALCLAALEFHPSGAEAHLFCLGPFDAVERRKGMRQAVDQFEVAAQARQTSKHHCSYEPARSARMPLYASGVLTEKSIYNFDLVTVVDEVRSVP